jgi:hypothetical protein
MERRYTLQPAVLTLCRLPMPILATTSHLLTNRNLNTHRQFTRQIQQWSTILAMLRTTARRWPHPRQRLSSSSLEMTEMTMVMLQERGEESSEHVT